MGIKKYALLIILVALFGIYVFFNRQNSSVADVPVTAETMGGVNTSSSQSQATSVTTPAAGVAGNTSIADDGAEGSGSDDGGGSGTVTVSPPAASAFAQDIGIGSRGTEVVALQQRLIADGYLTAVSSPTGYFGAYTRAALAKFQAANKISPAIGFLDVQTRDLLNSGTPIAPAVASVPTSAPVTAPAQNTGTYKDGSYNGSVADAYFGNLQVQAVISRGKLTDCIPLQYPNDSGHSLQVSRIALPALKQEAIQSQSANVNIVSGATQTSQAFQESLASALALARN